MAAKVQRRGISMNPAYKEINQSRARFLVFWGGAGSGKSVNIARLLVSRLTFGPPGVHWLVVRKDKDANSDSTRAELVNAINAILGDQADDWWDVPASRLTLTNKRNGNSFIFRGVKDESQREKLKSITVSSGNIEGAWVEEATQILPTDFDQINARLRGKLPEGHYYQTILSFNPVSSTHWLKRRFFDRKDPDAVTCHTTRRDNRFLNADYGRELAKTAETNLEFAQIYERGEWGDVGGLILTNWTVERVDHDLTNYDAVAIGQDFGFNHANAVLLLGWKDGEVYVIAEHYVHGMTTAEIIAEVERIKIFAEAKKSRVWMICDSAEPDRIVEWQRAGWKARPVDKGKGKATGSRIDWLKARMVHIGESCENTAAEMGEWSYRKDRTTGTYTDEPEPVNDDAMAALRYGCEPFHLAELKHRRPSRCTN